MKPKKPNGYICKWCGDNFADTPHNDLGLCEGCADARHEDVMLVRWEHESPQRTPDWWQKRLKAKEA